MRSDFAELNRRVKSVETLLLTTRPNAASGEASFAVEVPEVDDEGRLYSSSRRSPASVALFRVRWAFRAFQKACAAKPNYLFAFLWPVLLHVIVLVGVRFYVRKTYFGA
jgi:hypothetical protein